MPTPVVTDQRDFPEMIARIRTYYCAMYESSDEAREIDFMPEDFTYQHWLARQNCGHLRLPVIRWLRLIALTEVVVAIVNNMFHITEDKARRIMKVMMLCRNRAKPYHPTMWAGTDLTRVQRSTQKKVMLRYVTDMYTYFFGTRANTLLREVKKSGLGK